MADFLSSLYGNQNTAGNFNPTTPAFDASSMYSSAGSFTDSLSANGGVDVMAGLASPTGAQQGGAFSNFFSNEQGGQGWGISALGAGMGVANTFLGFQQLSEGKKQNRIAQNQWQQQFDIQKSEYDRRVSERADRIANADAAKAKAGLGG
jgi:hypothetical protein